MALIFLSLVFFCLILFTTTYNKKFGDKSLSMLMWLMIISLAFLGAFVVPRESYDLYRHYADLQRIRNSGLSLPEFLKKAYMVTDINYKYTYTYNILAYIVANYLPKEALPFIAIIITYGLLSYILKCELQKKYDDNRVIIITFAIHSIFIPYLYVYSGVRNTIAASIMGFAIYRFYNNDEKKKILEFIILAIVAALFHPVVLATIPFMILSFFKPGIIGMIIIILIPQILNPLMEWFRLGSGVDFLFRIGAKYYNYTRVRVDNQGQSFLYGVLILGVLLTITIFMDQRLHLNEKTKGKDYVLNFLFLYMLFSLSFFRNYEMATRLPYVTAMFSPVIADRILTTNNTAHELSALYQLVINVITLVMSILVIYQCMAWMG